MRTRWIILPVMLLCMACSKQAIDAPAIQREQLQPEYGPFVYPNGREEGSGIDPHGKKGDQGSGIDPNGKTDPPANTDAGSSMDPNGKPAAGSGFGIDPNGKDSGPRMDDNGKKKDSGPGMDPNGKPGTNGKGMGLDPNG